MSPARVGLARSQVLANRTNLRAASAALWTAAEALPLGQGTSLRQTAEAGRWLCAAACVGREAARQTIPPFHSLPARPQCSPRLGVVPGLSGELRSTSACHEEADPACGLRGLSSQAEAGIHSSRSHGQVGTVLIDQAFRNPQELQLEACSSPAFARGSCDVSPTASQSSSPKDLSVPVRPV